MHTFGVEAMRFVSGFELLTGIGIVYEQNRGLIDDKTNLNVRLGRRKRM